MKINTTDSNSTGSLSYLLRNVLTRFWKILLILLAFAVFLSCAPPAAIPPTPSEPLLPNEKALEEKSQAYYHYLRSRQYWISGKFQESIQELKEATKYDPRSMELHLALARFYLLFAEQTYGEEASYYYRLAAREYEEILVFHPQEAKIFSQLGSIQAALGNAQEAVYLLNKALELDPELSQARQSLADVYFRYRKYEKAIEQLEILLKQKPNSVSDLLYLGRVYQEIQMFGEAETYYKKALELGAYNKALKYLAQLYEAQGKTDQALEAYQKLVELDPQDLDVQELFASFLNRTDMVDQAVNTYRHLLQEKPNDLYLRLHLALTLMKAKNFQEAAEELQEALKIDPEHPGVNFYLGLVDYYLGLLDESAAYLKKTFELDPGNLDAKLLYSDLLVDKKEYQPALEWLEEIQKDNPKLIDIYVRQANIYSTLKQLEKAAEALHQAIILEPSELDYYNMLGFILMDLNRYEEGIAVVNEGLKIEPDNADLTFLAGALYEKQGDTEKAIEQMKKAIELDPELADAYNFLGYIYAEKGINLEESYQAIQKALELDPDNGAYLDSMGWLYYQKGEPEKALEYLQKASEKLAEDPLVLEHLGDAYLKNGYVDRALEEWQKALAIDPDNKKLNEKIKIHLPALLLPSK